MSTKFILKNKSTQEINNTTGSLAELFIDTSKHSLVVMDGETSGGVPLALESFVTANSLPDKSSAENNYLTINTSGESEWVTVDLSLLPIGTVIDSFKDLPSEYFLKFDGTLRSTEDYPEFTNIYTNESVLAIPTLENSPSNFFNRTAYTEMLYATSSPDGFYRRDLSLPRSTDNMVFDGTYYVRILGHEDLNYNKNIVTQYGARYYYPALATSDAGTPSDMLVTYNVTQPPPEFATIPLVHTLNNPNAFGTSNNDQFGNSVAISGDYAIVSARNEDDNSGTNSGKVYIFNVTTGALVHTLNNPNAFGTIDNDFFGNSVAISGNYAIVGADFEDDAGGTESGKAYIFNVTTGALVHTLNNPNAFGSSDGDLFGCSVAISGDYAIVGAKFEDAVSNNDTSGKAYIFNVTTGALVHTLNNPNAFGTDSLDQFGSSVAISGNYAIIGTPEEDDNSGDSSGKAYIFNVTTGALVHTLNNPNPYADALEDRFGSSVAISGNYAIVGAEFEDEPANNQTGMGGPTSGKAYIFDVTTGALVHTLNNPNGYSDSGEDRFGNSVAISDNYAIVGAKFEDDAGGSSSGKAYIFNVTTGALVHTLDNPNPFGSSASDQFANSVAISGDYIIVGASLEDDAAGGSSGKSYIYNIESIIAPTRLDLTKVAGIPQYFPPGYTNYVGKNFEEAYWETSNGSHRVVIRINMTGINTEIWGILGLFGNDPFVWRTEEQWAIDEQLYNDAQNAFPPDNSYNYLRPMVYSVQYEGRPTDVNIPRTWENPLVTVFNVGSVTPPDGTEFKIQRSLDGINWTTFTVAPFSNNATRCYSVLADEDNGKIYMVAQALPNLNQYNPLTNTESDATSDIVVMSSDHGSTWVEIAAPFKNTGRVLTYNNITKSLYLFNGKELTRFNKPAPLGPENPPKVTVANTTESTIQFNPILIPSESGPYPSQTPYPYNLDEYFFNYATVKNDLLMYIQAHPVQANQGGNFEQIANGEYIEREYEQFFRCGQQVSLLVDTFLWEDDDSQIQSFYGNSDAFFPEADRNKFKNEICFCKVPATFSNSGAIVTPDRIYGIFKHKNNTYKIYVQKDFLLENFNRYGFTFYADVELPGFSVYNELLFETGLDSTLEQKGISKFHWSPLFGFMVLTKNKIYYNLDPINNKSWNKINGLDESKNYQFLTCINTPSGVLVSGMNDVVYVTIPDNKFLLSTADTTLLNKYQTSKYIKVK